MMNPKYPYTDIFCTCFRLMNININVVLIMKHNYYLLLIVLALSGCSKEEPLGWKNLASPEVGQVWVQPAQGKDAQPIWGHANGMRIGLAPMPGPRGLLRVYTPYLGHKQEKMINFIALEPIPKGSDQRGFSELEMSSLDDRRGKRFWSADDSLATEPKPEIRPSRGVVREINGVETLTVFVFSERFENGANVYVRLRFYENRPNEVEIATYATPGSNDLENFIVTATMGNFARLRNLYLADGTRTSGELWPDYNETNFTPHAHFSVENFISDKEGRAYFIAAPDEKRPQETEYAEGTKNHWKYYGSKATQYWYVENPDDKLEGLVNGRFTYWASKDPIPGGVSFENFELKAPFSNGLTFVFGVSPSDPQEFIQEIRENSAYNNKSTK